MSLLHKYHEFHLLSEFLKKEGVPDAYPIYFREESEADNRFALSVSIHPRNGRIELLRKLAAFFGCPDDELPNPEDDSFEASDGWHGGANGDLRELADEMAKDLGEGFFDTDYTVGQIHTRGAMLKELQRADLVHYTADESQDPALFEAMVSGLEQTRQFLSNEHDCDHWKLAMVVFNPEAPDIEYLVVGSAGEEALEKEIEKLMLQRGKAR